MDCIAHKTAAHLEQVVHTLLAKYDAVVVEILILVTKHERCGADAILPVESDYHVGMEGGVMTTVVHLRRKGASG